MQSEPITKAERNAVINLFKEIAEFGHRVRKRRARKAIARCENPQNKKTHCDVGDTSQAS